MSHYYDHCGKSLRSKFKGKQVGDDRAAPQWAGLHHIILTQGSVRKGSSTCGQPKTVCRGTADLQPDFHPTCWRTQSVAGREGGFLYTSFGFFSLPQSVIECNYVQKYTHQVNK